MLLNQYRKPPRRNALNKYAVNLGATADEVKEYFDISVYRNVLDMLNTFEGVLNRWGLDLHDNAIWMYGFPSGAMSSGQANVGYAIKMSGQSHGWNEVYIYARKQCAKYGLKPAPPTWNTRQGLMSSIQGMNSGSQATKNHRLAIVNGFMALKGAYFNVADLLNLARQINWELNRVRLPIPHNFRQINEKIQGRDYKITPPKEGYTGTGEYAEKSLIGGNNKNYITLMQLMDVYGQLKSSINTLRVSTRKEIDAANLAAKVQEETLRREQEELITRQAAEALAEENRLRILEEKRIAYEKEIAEADAVKAELAKVREELAIELQLLQDAKAVADEPELVAIEIKENEIINAAEKVDVVEADLSASEQTAREAAINLNEEIKTVAENMPLVDTTKKTGLTPLIITGIVGLLLT